jgi:hypothetical protein
MSREPWAMSQDSGIPPKNGLIPQVGCGQGSKLSAQR